jgi:hypothetical protein
MTHHASTLPTFALALLAGTGTPALAAAQDAPPVRFFALVRERGEEPQPDWSDMQVALWDLRPAATADQAVRRQVLGRSPWLPSPLLDSPELLRWQIPAERRGRGNGYTVAILQVGREPLGASQLWTGDQAHAIGAAGERIYLRTPEGTRVLDRATGAAGAPEPAFARIAAQGDRWLVAFADHVAILDAATGTVLQPLRSLPAPGREQGEGQWDGGRWVVFAAGYQDEQGNAAPMPLFRKWELAWRQLLVWDLQTQEQRTIRVRAQVQGGSGEPFLLPRALAATALRDGRLQFVERRPATGEHADLAGFTALRDAERVTFDLAEWREIARVPCTANDELAAAAAPREPNAELVPAWLAERRGQSPIGSWGLAQDVAWAFLTHAGCAVELPEHGVQKFDAVAWAPRRGELLVLHRGSFHHGDLATRALRSWPAPAEFAGVLVELHVLE